MIGFQGAILSLSSNAPQLVMGMAGTAPVLGEKIAEITGSGNATTPAGIFWSAVSVLVAGGLGVFVWRRNRGPNSVEDAGSALGVTSLQSAQEQIKALNERVAELQKENWALFDQVGQTRQAMILAESNAQRASVEADNAKRASDTAAAAAAESARLLEETRGTVRVQLLYIARLQETMKAHNVTIPPYVEA
jgi:uncharacterized protein YlxW (UPF0749 family)